MSLKSLKWTHSSQRGGLNEMPPEVPGIEYLVPPLGVLFAEVKRCGLTEQYVTGGVHFVSSKVCTIPIHSLIPACATGCCAVQQACLLPCFPTAAVKDSTLLEQSAPDKPFFLQLALATLF